MPRLMGLLLNNLAFQGTQGGEAVSYLIRDDFATDLASGDIQASAADPGPGVRYVQSLGGYPVIRNNWMEFSAWNTSDGTPGLWLPYDANGLTPAQGITAVGRIKGDGVNPIWANFGWDVNRGSHLSQMALAVEDNVLKVHLTSQSFKTLSVDEIVDVAAITSGSGGIVLLFVKTSTTYPQWTFIRQAAAPSYTALWVGSSKTSNAYVQKHFCKTMRVPESYFIPAPIISDGFNQGSFGVSDGMAHGITSGTGAGGSGVTWTNRVGTWGVSGSRAKAATLSGGIAIATAPTGVSDVDLRLTQVFKGLGAAYGYIGGIVRFKDVDNYVRVSIGHDGSSEVLECTEVVAGTPTQHFKIGPPAYSFTTGRNLIIRVQGNTLDAFYGDASVSGATATLTLAGAATDEVGVMATATSGSDLIEGLVVRPITSNAYAFLDAYLSGL